MTRVVYKKYERSDQRILATWAADCADRVLHYFQEARPKDDRPRKAIRGCREWVRTGVFRMADVRAQSLGAHAAARATPEDSPARFAARAAGHSVATAHVPQHALGSAFYALRAIAAAEPSQAKSNVAEERRWQFRRLPTDLRRDMEEFAALRELDTRLQVFIRKVQRADDTPRSHKPGRT